jgi:hypothetical protein
MILEFAKAHPEVSSLSVVQQLCPGLPAWEEEKLARKLERDRNKPAPTPFGVERAKEIWAARGMCNDISRVVTPGEDAYVKLVWDTLDGASCWMSAFYLILNGKDPLPSTR